MTDITQSDLEWNRDTYYMLANDREKYKEIDEEIVCQ